MKTKRIKFVILGILFVLLMSGCGGGGSSNTDIVPAAPTNVTATAGDGKVILSWTASVGATDYEIYQSTTSGTYGAKVGVSSTNNYTATGLTNGTKYYFIIKAVNSKGTSPASSEVNATPQQGVQPITGAAISGKIPLNFAASKSITGIRKAELPMGNLEVWLVVNNYKAVYKYPVASDGSFTVDVDKVVEDQKKDPYVWAEMVRSSLVIVDPSATKENQILGAIGLVIDDNTAELLSFPLSLIKGNVLLGELSKKPNEEIYLSSYSFEQNKDALGISIDYAKMQVKYNNLSYGNLKNQYLNTENGITIRPVYKWETAYTANSQVTFEGEYNYFSIGVWNVVDEKPSDPIEGAEIYSPNDSIVASTFYKLNKPNPDGGWDIGLLYLYDMTIGQFIETDPMQETDGLFTAKKNGSTIAQFFAKNLSHFVQDKKLVDPFKVNVVADGDGKISNVTVAITNNIRYNARFDFDNGTTQETYHHTMNPQLLSGFLADKNFNVSNTKIKITVTNLNINDIYTMTLNPAQ